MASGLKVAGIPVEWGGSVCLTPAELEDFVADCPLPVGPKAYIPSPRLALARRGGIFPHRDKHWPDEVEYSLTSFFLNSITNCLQL
eukprot:4847236-Pyramimonas_sp.AAC.1